MAVQSVSRVVTFAGLGTKVPEVVQAAAEVGGLRWRTPAASTGRQRSRSPTSVGAPSESALTALKIASRGDVARLGEQD